MLNGIVLFHFTLWPTIRSTTALGWLLLGLEGHQLEGHQLEGHFNGFAVQM